MFPTSINHGLWHSPDLLAIWQYRSMWEHLQQCVRGLLCVTSDLLQASHMTSALVQYLCQQNLSEFLASVLLVRNLGHSPCVNTKVWRCDPTWCLLWESTRFSCPGHQLNSDTSCATLSPTQKKMNIHWSQPLTFDWIICDAFCYDVVEMYQGIGCGCPANGP